MVFNRPSSVIRPVLKMSKKMRKCPQIPRAIRNSVVRKERRKKKVQSGQTARDMTASAAKDGTGQDRMGWDGIGWDGRGWGEMG